MHRILIAGVPRSGKSTVAKSLDKRLGGSYIPFDSIVSTMGNLFPEHGIMHTNESKAVSQKIAVFLNEFLKHLNYERISYIIDVYPLFPEDLTAMNCRNVVVCFFGYPSVDVNAKVKAIREHAQSDDWTESISDQQLSGYVERYIQESARMREQCRRSAYVFYDTGTRFGEVIQQAIHFLIKNVED